MTQFSIAFLAALDAAGKREEFFSDIRDLVCEKKFYTPEDVADRYQVTKQCLKIWRTKGLISPSMKMAGGTVRYTQRDLDAFEKLTGREEAKKDA